uniref:Integrin, alpha 5 (fibronectin receptor, alpha polypeptide) n=1 Tax=Cyclopterus lumpus TaxID=8103 RepID=A0A8C3AGG2_CYCLU
PLPTSMPVTMSVMLVGSSGSRVIVYLFLSFFCSASVVIGAPKANTKQAQVTEGGSVFYCPWSLSQADCHTIDFDTEGDRTVLLNDTEHQVDFKSHQWFGATVRSHGDTILACAPLYSWRTEQDYAPCRTEISDAVGQGYCQGGFSADFTTDGRVVLGGPGSYFWQGQVITAAKEDIIKAYYPGFFMQSVEGQIQTRQVKAEHDDSYQGYSIAVGEFSGDQVEGKMADLLVGAPMFMVRGSDGRLEEMGRVYVYLQRGPGNLELHLPYLTGSQVYGRFGSTIAPLGDLNQDGFNDVAISCPFGGEDRQGLVYIYNGYSEGLREKPSQVITGQWAAGAIPASFGFALRGAKDLDMNGYPDLIVGAFGVNKAVLYRSRPIVNTSASLTVHPTMINPEEKNCMVTNGNTSIPVSCVNLSFCISADGKHLPDILGKPIFHICPLLVVRKFYQNLYISTHSQLFVQTASDKISGMFLGLQDEKDFRDKLSSIYVALNFSLDPKAAADSHGLRPILNYQTTNVIEQKAQILLDCGEDNICVPDLKLELWAGLRFTVPRLKDTHTTVQFELQIRSKNENNSHISGAFLRILSHPFFFFLSVSRPDKVFFPPANWKVTKNYDAEQDVGPAVEHIYELVNNGPSRISHTLLELRCPLSVQGQTLLYPLEFSIKGPINCTADGSMNHLRLKVSVSQSQIRPTSDNRHLPLVPTQIAYKHYVLECLARYSVEKMPYAILPRNAPSGHKKVVTPVVWNKPDIENSVPLWIIILAILAGLLLLALLIYVLYKFGFFKRSLPYGTAMEKAQLKPQAASEA